MVFPYDRHVPRSQWKRLPKDRPVTRNQDKNLTAILNYIKDCKLSFGSFVEACLCSDDLEVKNKVDQFYSSKYPARCLDLWSDEIAQKHSDSLLTSAVKFVLKYAQPEIEKASHTCNLKFPASSATADAVDQISFRKIEQELAEHAPTSYALLRGLINHKRPSPFEPVTPVIPVVA
ncbi:hypothetical protein BG000_006593, partial [Podila horticola]